MGADSLSGGGSGGGGWKFFVPLLPRVPRRKVVAFLMKEGERGKGFFAAPSVSLSLTLHSHSPALSANRVMFLVRNSDEIILSIRS